MSDNTNNSKISLISDNMGGGTFLSVKRETPSNWEQFYSWDDWMLED